MAQVRRYKILVQELSEIIAFLPFLAPIIEANIDSTNPPHIGIHIGVIQKFGSIIAAIIPIALQMMGTYQMLLGFFLTIKKQQIATTIPYRI